jgi:hypothetical protein
MEHALPGDPSLSPRKKDAAFLAQKAENSQVFQSPMGSS